MEDKEIRNFISKELENLEFKRYTKGFKYLNEAILLCIKNIDLLDNLNKNVFSKIAEAYNEKSLYNVKWCIEQVIKTMYNNTPISTLCDYFKIEENIKPSLKFIIYTIVCKYNRTYC